MDPLVYDDALIAGALRDAGAVAVVGLSADPSRPSYDVFAFWLGRGRRAVGVNPALAGRLVLGAPVYARLGDVPEPIDLVDVFRASNAAGGVVDEALALTPKPRAIWMQLGVRDDAAAARAAAAGVLTIMDRCPKIEYPRLARQIGR